MNASVFPDSPSLRLTRIQLKNWRNFYWVENLPLQRRLFLIGPNASGKSNFLDALRFLRDITVDGGGFAKAVDGRGGLTKVRSLAARQDTEVKITVCVGTDERPELWEYEIGFDDPGGSPQLTAERVTRDGEILLMRPDEEDRADLVRMTQTSLQQMNVNKDFREVADFFSSIQYSHIVPQIVRQPQRSTGADRDPFGEVFLKRIAMQDEGKRKERLEQIGQMLRIAVPQMKDLEFWEDGSGSPHLRVRYEHWRPRGAWQTEEQFSDGTIRLLGMLWNLLESGGPLLFEEPELSLHPAIVRQLPQLFARMQSASGRQIVLSTHSSEILLDEGIGLDEVLLLTPDGEGTRVRLASEHKDVVVLVEEGLGLADAVFPLTQPSNAHQLSFTLFQASQ